MYYVYIIESGSTGRWYYGFTQELVQRLEAHNNGLNKSTSNRGPWKYIFFRQFEVEREARQFENYLKKSRNKEYIKRVFSQYFVS